MYKRGSVWYAHINGIRKSSGTADRKAAEAYFAKLKQEAWNEERMGAKPQRTWQEAVVRYLKEEDRNRASYGWKVGVLRWWAEQLPDNGDIRRITRDVVAEICDRSATSQPSAGNNTLNKKAGLLHHLLRKACEEWEWIDRVPKFRAYPIPESRDQWLTVEKWQLLSKMLPADLRDFTTFALATGLRSSKLTNLVWSAYDVTRRVLNVSGTRNKRANPIPLNQTATSILEARRLARTRHLTRVFPEFDGPPIKKHWRTFAKVRAIPGLEGVGIHTLRHTFNTWLAQDGVPREIRMKLMGHAPVDVHEVYTHWADQQLRPAVEVIDKMLNLNSVPALERSVADSAR